MADVVVVGGVDGARGARGADGADREAHWVLAGPFRAHLAHVMAVGDMSVEVVAAMTGVSACAARHLLRGRNGRPLRRISTETGRRLLRLTSADARTVRRRLVPARGAAGQLRELLDRAHDLRSLARRSGLDETVLADLAAGSVPVCSPLVAAQVAAVHAALDAAPGAAPGAAPAAALDAAAEVRYPLAS